MIVASWLTAVKLKMPMKSSRGKKLLETGGPTIKCNEHEFLVSAFL